MLVYCALIAFLAVLSFVNYQTKSDRVIYGCLMGGAVALFLVSGLRFEVGADYQHFIEEFNVITNQGLRASYTEIGFALLALLIHSVGLGGEGLYFVCSLILMVSVAYFICRCIDKKFWCFSLLLFVLFGFFFSSMNLSRQYLGVSVAVFGVAMYCSDSRHRLIPFVALTIAGALFHTAVILLLATPIVVALYRSKWGFKVAVALYVVSLVCVVVDIREIIKLILPLISRWSWYANSEFFNDRNFSAITKLVVPNLIFVITLFRLRREGEWSEWVADNRGGGVLALFSLYLFSQNAFYGIMVLTRVSELFFVGVIAHYSMAGTLARSEKERKLYYGVLVVYGLLLTVVTIFIMGGNGVMPYRSVLFR